MPEVSSWSRERARLLDQEAKIRVALVLFVAVLLAMAQDVVKHPPAVIAALALMVAILGVSRYGIKRRRLASAQEFQISAVVLGILDIITVTLLVVGTGGANSSFFPFYLVCLIFAATFFRGIELVLMTAIACALYAAVTFSDVVGPTTIWNFSSRLGAIIIVAWYTYALSGVLHSEKYANDQLLRHLAEGVLVFDAQNRVVMVSPTFSSMFGVSEAQLLGLQPDDMKSYGGAFDWLIRDVIEGDATVQRCTRTGRFPEIDLPLLEVSTIPCGEPGQYEGGWVVVCRDLRDQDDRQGEEQLNNVCDKVSPLANLRALSQTLYDLADSLHDDERWRAVALIEEHTRALKGLLTEILHEGGSIGSAYLDLRFADAAGLLTSTRRLLEIQPKGAQLDIELRCADDLPLIRADRSRLGRCILYLCRTLLDLARPGDKLNLEARVADKNMVFEFELAPPDGKALPAADTGPSNRVSTTGEAWVKEAFEKVLPIITEHHGHWEFLRHDDRYCRISVSLPVANPQGFEANASQSPLDSLQVIPTVDLATSETPRLSAESFNHLNNILSAIRGYAELALSTHEETRIVRALSAAISLSDQASELGATFGPPTASADKRDRAQSSANTDLLSQSALMSDGPLRPTGPVLIVDDQDSIRMVLTDIFEGCGYEVKAFADGGSAIDLLREQTPAVAFVDLLMPGVDGLAVLRAAKEFQPQTPVIIMSGSGTEATLSSLDGEIPFNTLQKPFAITEVLSLAEQSISDS